MIENKKIIDIPFSAKYIVVSGYEIKKELTFIQKLKGLRIALNINVMTYMVIKKGTL